MKLTYTKLSQSRYKFFYQDGDRYGEFYVKLEDPTKVNGEAVLEYKDYDHAQSLITGFVEELVEPAPTPEKTEFEKLQEMDINLGTEMQPHD